MNTVESRKVNDKSYQKCFDKSFFAPFIISEGCPKKYSHFLRTSPFTQRNIYILYGDFAGTKLAFMNQESGLSIFDIITNTTTQIMDNTVFVRIYNQIFRIDIS